ncbi:hypothetical protein GCM10022251_77010 [Phytohabitans flavus]|uniref:Uncharacterized protein n=1 Tax=Phytohabitans flavus TaxID=1076124 RepID=A0A6F8XLQ3_9ACTN|nr:hypothetical protein [Phytohabitans flavus]BCB74728.1 hypothetical protein Pflav_011380 [Phytohabitans flavus]
MDVAEFYAVVSGINFTLLGLWWVAVQERPQLRDTKTGTDRLAYAVSLQFLLPGTAALFALVAVDAPFLWQAAFLLAGVAGSAGILLLAPALRRAGVRVVRLLLYLVGLPLYLLVALTAILPFELGNLSGLHLEAMLFGLLILVGTQTAWTAAMFVPEEPPAPSGDVPAAAEHVPPTTAHGHARIYGRPRND